LIKRDISVRRLWTQAQCADYCLFTALNPASHAAAEDLLKYLDLSIGEAGGMRTRASAH
jgi:hypothetical protein